MNGRFFGSLIFDADDVLNAHARAHPPPPAPCVSHIPNSPSSPQAKVYNYNKMRIPHQACVGSSCCGVAAPSMDMEERSAALAAIKRKICSSRVARNSTRWPKSEESASPACGTVSERLGGSNSSILAPAKRCCRRASTSSGEVGRAGSSRTSSLYPWPYLDLSVWMGPTHRSDPSTMMPMRPQSASHSSIEWVVSTVHERAEALRGCVHPGRRLVEQHERRPADERDADAQLALVATRVGASWLVGVFGQIKQLEQILHIGFDDGVGHRLDARIKAKCLAARHQRLERVVLRAVADARAYAGLLPPDGHTVECGVSGGGHHGAGEHVERGRLSGAVCAEEAEALTLTDAQGHVTHGHLDAVHFMQVGEDELLMGVPGVDGSALSAHRLVLKAAAGEALPHGRYDARVDRLSVGLGCGGGLAEQLPAAVEKHLRDRSGLVVLKQQCDCPKKDTLADERHEWRAELV
eukprot:scaffold3076_cov117-Isochrysis_galbana.AAC.3